MEEKVTSNLLRLQCRSLACSPSKLSACDWSKQLIGRVLHIFHGQSIFCNTVQCSTRLLTAAATERPSTGSRLTLTNITRVCQRIFQPAAGVFCKLVFLLWTTTLWNNKVIGFMPWRQHVMRVRESLWTQHPTVLLKIYDGTITTHLFSQQHHWHHEGAVRRVVRQEVRQAGRDRKSVV